MIFQDRAILKGDGVALMVSPVWIKTMGIHSMLTISPSKIEEHYT